MYHYENVLVQGSDLILNGNISDVVGKHGKILGIVIFIFKNVRYVFVKTTQWGATIGTPGLCIFG